MNNHENPFIERHNDLKNLQKQQQSQGISQIERKKLEFHKEIRRKQIQDILKAKRKILHQNIGKATSNQSPSNKKTLMSCLNSISSNENLDSNICALVNLLALQKPFEHYSLTQSNPSTHLIDTYCIDMINLLLKKVIPQFSNQTNSRINCFNAIANLFADPLCQNVRHVKTVIQSINEFYGGIDTWGCDRQMIEIYYMIANLQRKTIIHTQLISVERLLDWGQTGISKLPSDPLKSLTEGFIKLFSDVDQMFNSHHHRSFFTDHFRASREIIIQNMIKRLIATGQGNRLNVKGDLSLDSECVLTIFKFLNKNRVYVLKVLIEWEDDMEQKRKVRQFCDRLMGLINQPTLKTSTLRQIGTFFVNMLRYYQQQEELEQFNQNRNPHDSNSQQLSRQIEYLNQGINIVHKQLLTGQPLNQIIISISHQSFQCKIIYLKIIYQLLYNIQRSLELPSQIQIEKGLRFILVDKKLEDILADLLSEMHSKLKNVDLLRIILDIYHVIINMTEGKLCIKLKQHVHSLLQSPPEFIPEDIFSIIEDLYNLHEEKLQQTII